MRILLVDDDAGAARAVVAVLNTLSGHEVRTAHTGEEALAVAAEMSGVDLLITDVVMEPMDGFTLRDQLVAQYPNVRTILISGYDLSEYPEQTQHHQLLSKPVDTDTLRAAVDRELPAAPEPEAEPQPAAETAPAAEAVPEPEPVAEATPIPVPEPEPVAAPVPSPVATPAVPVAAPTAVPVPVPVATPVAKPVAVPATAKPVAVPVAKPAAIPSPRVAVAAKAVAAPVATPAVKATPAVRATAVPVPAAAAQPTAQPTARPQAVPVPATPAAAPVAVAATPKAVPAAQPVVTAKATAVPRPAVAVPVPAAPTAPTATPAAQPSTPAAPAAASPSAALPAQPTVRMTPTVKAQPVQAPGAPGATPVVAKAATPGVPVAKPASTAPQARPAAVPVPTPRPAATAATAVQTKTLTPAPGPNPAAPATAVAMPVGVPPPSFSAPSVAATPAVVGSGEDLSGKMLGAYQIIRKMGESRWGGIYAGTQTSINRAVSIEVLDTTKAADETAQARFVADARAKAAVQHPSILAVYEAGEAEGRFFYAYEYVDGQTIAELKAAGKRLDEPTALKVLQIAADGLSYFNVHHTPHTPPDANSVSLGIDGRPRLANLATQLADETLTPPQEIQALGRVMLGVLPAIQSLSPGLREMLKRMVQAGPQAFNSWGQVLQTVKALEPKIVPTDAAKINAQDRAAIAAVEQARKQQKRSLIYKVASVGSLVLLIAVTAWYFLRNKQRIYDEQIQVPAGEFIFANGQKKTLPDFWIDKYEVTFGQYAEFVKALEARPTTEYDHKDQPKLKASMMHKPYNWEIYYGNAREGRAAHSTPIDLSCPVLEVDFWDAYAYAKWKGRELPTEEEWEKAARGTQGFLYPWGNDPDLKKANSNADFNEDPRVLGTVDGFNYWNPVDKILGDKSPYGVFGMAGNVREWTGTWDLKSRRVIAKGGSFKSTDSRVDQRVDLDPSAHDESLGFRTITRTPPSK